MSSSGAEKLTSFLHHGSELVRKSFDGKVSFVMGNEASDMDSIVSSIIYAYFKQLKVKPEEHLYLPLINIPREDFPLRTESQWIFDQLGLKTDNLLFYPEVTAFIESKVQKSKLNFILVDHNKLSTSQSFIANLIEEIVDHHTNEGLKVPKVIEMVGSCTSLVAEKIAQNAPELFDNVVVSKLLLGTILLDTVNLDPKYKKVTPKDESIAKTLSAKLKFTSEQQTTFFNELQEKRFDVSALGTYDLLRADYKQFQMNKVSVGISSCKRSFKEWFQKDPNFIANVDRYFNNSKIDILFIMTQYMDEKNAMHRELGTYSKDKNLHNEALEFLKTTDLNLVPINNETTNALSKGHVISFYDQKNIGASRKQLQPFLDGFYKKK